MSFKPKGGNGFESLHPHDKKIEQVRVSGFLSKFGDTKRDTLHKPPKLVLGDKWFIEYWYKIPADLRHLYPGPRRFKRFKVYEDINRHRTEQYANDLLKAVRSALEQGYDPFNEIRLRLNHLNGAQRGASIKDAFDQFMIDARKRNLSPSHFGKLERSIERLLSTLSKLQLDAQPPDSITPTIISNHLDKLAEENEWSNRTYNNELDNLTSIFTFLVKRKLISDNPAIDIPSKKTKPTKHKFYGEKLFEKVKDVLQENDPYLLFACQCVYYLCIRSEKELMNLRVQDVHLDRKQVFISDGKTGQRYIPISDEMIRIFEERGVLGFPGQFYVFSVAHRNKFIPDGSPGPEPFGTGFFSKRFSKLRSKMGVSSDYTIYGFKHTRVVHLKTDNIPDADIMALTGHTDYKSYAAYLRDLGVNANPENINKATRKM